MIKKISCVLIALLVAFCGTAVAQRTSKGASFVDVSYVSSFTGSGVQAGFGIYGLRGYWKVEISGVDRMFELRKANDEYISDMSCMHLEGAADYMFRLYGRRNHVLNLYGGGGAFLGLESLDPYGKAPANIVLPFEKKSVFLYGVEAAADAEWFPLSRAVPNLALVGGIRLPVNFTSQVQKFCYELSVGLRYDF